MSPACTDPARDSTRPVGATPFTTAADGVRVKVRVTPRAAANRIDGLGAEPDGGVCLKIAVTAPPEGGKANTALIEALARAWRLPKSALAVRAGLSSRGKTVRVEGDPAEVMTRLDAWLRWQDFVCKG